MECVIDYLKEHDHADIETLFKVSGIDSKGLNELLRKGIISKYESEDRKTIYYLCEHPVKIHIDSDIRALFEEARKSIEDIPTPIEIQERARLFAKPEKKKRKKKGKIASRYCNEHLRGNPTFNFLFQEISSS